MSRRWGLLILVFAGILISYVDRGNLSIAAPAIMRDFKIPPNAMGVLLSAFFWTYASFQIPAGLLIDRVGTRFVYAGAFLLWSLASAGVALSRGPNDVLALRLVLGLAESVGPLASLAFIRQSFNGSEQGLPVSIYVAGQTIGPACGALLGATLLTDFGWRALFAVTGLGALMWVPVWAYFAPRHTAAIHEPAKNGVNIQRGTRTSAGLVPGLAAHTRELSASKSKVEISKRVESPWPDILGSAALWAMSACVLFFSYYWYFVLTWMPSYLMTARGYSALDMGAIFSKPLFAMAVVNVAAGFFADRMIKARGKVLLVRLWFAAFGMIGASSVLLLNVLRSRGAILPILICSICSFGLASSNYWAIAQYTSPSALVGRAIGVLNTLSQIGGVIAPLVTGWTLGPHKNFGPAILIAGLCPLVSVALLIVAGPKKLNALKVQLEQACVL